MEITDIPQSGPFAPPKKSSAAKAKVADRTKGERSATVKGFTDPIAALLIGIGVQTQNVPFVADGVVLSQMGPQLADAVAEWAEHNDKVARVLDTGAGASDIVGVLAILVMMGAQVAVNHGRVPAGVIPGTRSPEDVAGPTIRHIQNEAARAAEAAAESAGDNS